MSKHYTVTLRTPQIWNTLRYNNSVCKLRGMAMHMGVPKIKMW